MAENHLGNFNLFPNPAQDYINVSLKSGNETIKNVSIYDLNGRLIKSDKASDNKIAVSELQSGTYIILIENTENQKFSGKFVKK